MGGGGGSPCRNVVEREKKIKEDYSLIPWFEIGLGRGVEYRQKKRGGGEEEARSFSTVRGAPQSGDGRTCMRQAEPQEVPYDAVRVNDLESFFCCLRGSGSSGSAVTNISGSTG